MNEALLGVSVLALLSVTAVYLWKMSGTRGRRWFVTLLPVSQLIVVICAIAFTCFDGFFLSTAPFLAVATALCVGADVAALPLICLGSRKEEAQQRERMAGELLKLAQVDDEAMAEEMQAMRGMRADIARRLKQASAQLASGAWEGERDGRSLSSSVLSGDSGEGGAQRYCQNAVVDALLALKAAKARDLGVALSVRASVPGQLAIEDVDLCAMFSNLIDNALHGAAEASGSRAVDIKACVNGSALVVETRNGIPASSPAKRGRRTEGPRPSPTREHGWGLDILGALAARYNGSFESAARGDQWVASLVVRCR